MWRSDPSLEWDWEKNNLFLDKQKQIIFYFLALWKCILSLNI
jgi:hypothetical protein